MQRRRPLELYACLATFASFAMLSPENLVRRDVSLDRVQSQLLGHVKCNVLAPCYAKHLACAPKYLVLTSFLLSNISTIISIVMS